MSFLGQALQRSPRTPQGVLRIIGIDVLSTAGAFSWTAPALVEYLDIIAVGGGGGTGTAWPAWEASGAVAQRVMKPVYPGLVITGVVGAAGSQGVVGGDTTVDGMIAKGAHGLTLETATGGDMNWPGVAEFGADIYSLTGSKIGPSIDGSSRWNGVTDLWGGASFPGGGAYNTSSNFNARFGGKGAVFFVMYRRKT